MTGGRRWRRCSTSAGRRARTRSLRGPAQRSPTIASSPGITKSGRKREGQAAQPMSTETQKESSGLRTWIHFLRYGLPVFAVMAAIFAVSQMSPATIDDISAFDTASGLLGRYTGDIAHFAEYFVLSVLILRWILAVKVPPGTARPDVVLVRSSAQKAVALAVLYGISDEAHQWFVNGRSVELLDLLVDGIGAVLGAAIYLSVYQAWRLQKSGGAGRSPGQDAEAPAGLAPNSKAKQGHDDE